MNLDDKEVLVLTVNRVNRSAAGERRLAAVLAFVLSLAVIVPAALSTTARAAEPTVVDMLFDFEDGTDGAGFFSYANAGGGVGDALGGFDASANAHALHFGFNTTVDPFFGGVGWNAPGIGWDFSAYDGIQLWVYGNGTANMFQIELQDNHAGTGTSENFDVDVLLNVDGWRLVRIPFADFNVAGYNPGPDNGVLDLDRIMAIVFKGVGDSTAAVDNVALYASPTETVDMWRDFEGDLGDGYESYEQAGAGLQPASELPAYGAEPNQYVLSYGFDTTQAPYYGGIQWFSPSPTTLWDFSMYDGIQMWVYGDGSGADFQIELQDLAAGPASPELFDINIPVGAAEWRLVKIPFADITLATDYQPTPGGHNGQLDLDAIRAVALPAGNSATATVKIDNIAFYAGGVVPPNVRIGTIANPFEGDTVSVPIVLNKAASGPVTVEYHTEDGTAIAGTHYTAASGTVTFSPGETSKTVTIPTADDATPNPNLTFTFHLSNPSGASLGTSTATITIRDNDAAPASTLKLLSQTSEDFELPLVYNPTTSENTAPLGWTDVFGAGNVPTLERVEDDTVPGTLPTNHVLEVNLNTSSWTALIYRFSEDGASWTTQDWSQYRSIGFWMKGSNSGTRLFMDVLDNRSSGSAVDDAERFTSTFEDDFFGWKFIELPLDSFARKDVGNGAPNDGFTLNEIHGFAIGNEAGTGTINLRFDDFVVIRFQDKVEDFELVLPAAAGTPPVGWASYGGGIGYQRVVDETAPAGEDGNHVLEVPVNSSEWGAVVRTFGTGTTWTPQDWSEYTSIGFWFQGENTGNVYDFDILDNRTSGSTGDDAERFTASFTDDAVGWRFIELPFSAFTRKDIGNGAPNDGFGRTEVHGFGFAHGGAVTATTFVVDDVTLLNNAERAKMRVGFDGQQFLVTEGDDAQVAVKLNRVPEADFSVGFTTLSQATDTTARFAVPGRDYVETTGTITFLAGQRTAVITIPTIDDDKPEVDEVFRVKLVSLGGTELLVNTAEATVTIIDDDTANPLGLEDFEYGLGQVHGIGTSLLNVREVGSSDADALPGQSGYNHVLDVSPGIDGVAGISRQYVVPQDWSGNDGLGFWYQGTGNGQMVTTFLRDAASTGLGDGDWELAWSDEFSGAAGSAPNPANWTNEINGHGWGNQELQYYTDSRDNSAHDGDGHLVITLREITDQAAFKAEQADKGYPETCHYGDCLFTSARLNSYDKVEFQYGRVESRAQLPAGEKGLWPAIWTLGANFFEGTDWPDSGEIDIMEYVGKLPNEIFGTLHGPVYNGGNAIHNIHDFTGDLEPGDSLGNKWMRFAIEWEPTEIRWYVALDSSEGAEDGEWIQYHSATPADAQNKGGAWVFDEPFFLIMNFAIGGNFGETPAPGITYPQEFKIDYVRVYRPAEIGDTYQYTFVDDTDGWRFVQLPFDGFTPSAQQVEGAPGDGLDLDKIAAFSVTVTGASTLSNGGIVPRFSVPMAAASAVGPVAFDSIQVLSLVTAATPVATAGGTGPGGGVMGDTGVSQALMVLLLLAMVLGVAGTTLVLRRRIEEVS